MFFCNHVKPENVSLLRGAKLHFAQVEFTNWAELKFASKRILFLLLSVPYFPCCSASWGWPGSCYCFQRENAESQRGSHLPEVTREMVSQPLSGALVSWLPSQYFYPLKEGSR